MSLTDSLLSQGQLENLDVYTKEGINRTIHYSKGRFFHKSNIALYNGTLGHSKHSYSKWFFFYMNFLYIYIYSKWSSSICTKS